MNSRSKTSGNLDPGKTDTLWKNTRQHGKQVCPDESVRQDTGRGMMDGAVAFLPEWQTSSALELICNFMTVTLKLVEGGGRRREWD